MYQNHLKMNDSKTEFVLFGNQVQLNKCSTSSIRVGGELIPVSDELKYLGVIIDPQVSLKSHIKKKVSIAMGNLFKIKRLSQFLSLDSAKQLMSALVLSHLDYSNGILANFPAATLRPMQVVQNFAARVALKRSRKCEAKACLRYLHWLPIEARSIFKICTMVYKCLHHTAPTYLGNRLHIKEHRRLTRQSVTNSEAITLEEPFNRCRTFGDRAFSYTGPHYWNSLPSFIRQADTLGVFKSRLKTHLFRKYF